MKITKRTVKEHIAALAKGEYSSLELTRAYLSEIEKSDGSIGAYLHINKKRALESATIADKMIKEGNAHPLCGIPFAVKDNICTKGIPTTAASKMLRSFVPPYDATVIEKLSSLGCVILGKTNMDEFAMGSTTENSAYITTKNPIDIARTPGGSSGGSCAAVAAGMSPFALGSDTGGSVRQPAAFTATVGLRPTYGAVSRYGLIAFASSLDVIGPVTKTAYDNALVFDAICGKDQRDATSRKAELFREYPVKPMKGLKIGVPKEFFSDRISDTVKNAVMKAAEKYRDMGAEFIPLSLPSLEYATAAYYIISSAEASSNLARYDGIRFGHRTKSSCKTIEELYTKSRSEGFGDEVKRRIMLGTFVLSKGFGEEYYKKAQSVRALIRADFERAFEKCDVIISPAAPTVPYLLGEKSSSPVDLYADDLCSAPASLASLPALTLPCREKDEALPVGMQLIGPAFSEKLLYFVGKAYEEVTNA